MRDRREQQEPISAAGVADVRRAQPHPEAKVLRVPERLFDGEALAVERDDLRGLALGQRRRKAPRVLHLGLVHYDDGGNRSAVGHHASGADHRRASGRRHPRLAGLLCPSLVLDEDRTPEPNHVVPAERLEKRVELLVSEV